MLKIIFVLYILVIIFYSRRIRADISKIDAELKEILCKGESANVIISFVRSSNVTHENSDFHRQSNRGDRNTAIKATLEQQAEVSQGGVRHILSLRSANAFEYYKHYWTSNKIFIKQASSELVKRISEDPAVHRIFKEPILLLPSAQEEDESEERLEFEPRSGPDPWGVKRIQAPEAWALLGSKGDGIVVGSIDSGVRHTHEVLRDNFVGIEYGWYDPINKKSEPYDTNGHGTHTIGSMVGANGFGVAPGAKWMSCMACEDIRCPAEAILDCIQWMSCPTLPDGTNPDCSKAPHIINNSWAAPRGDDRYNADILNLRALGIIPVFAVGNTGPQCGTTTAPGEMPFVIGVGATKPIHIHRYQSSVGPASDGSIKPDISAPGAYIGSSCHESDSDYRVKSGTSMASPHVAGVVALLKVRQPDLTYEEVYKLLIENTNQKIRLHQGILHKYCNEGAGVDVFPNIYLGYGEVNALKAVEAQTLLLQGRK